MPEYLPKEAAKALREDFLMTIDEKFDPEAQIKIKHEQIIKELLG